MRKTMLNKAGVLAVMVLLMISLFDLNAFAAVHDPTEDVSTDIATLVLGKELSYINKQYNPVEKVRYKIEKVRAWHNENVSTDLNGTPIEVSEMPDPEATDIEIILNEARDGSASGKEEVKIIFDQAGYYVYKISEYPIMVDGADTYNDEHEYFAVIYVCNRTDSSGNTIPGVYVHDITSYRNLNGSEEYVPDLSDIARVTDNNGEEAAENNQENMGKVGKSSPEEPNVLEAYRMWNIVTYPEPVDLTVTKNVTGSLGDITKEFLFTVTITGTEPGGIYVFSGSGEMNVPPINGTYDGVNGTLTSDADGTIIFTYRMKDDQTFTIADLPKGAEWSVTESASNHKASYTVSPEECAITAEAQNEESGMELTAQGELLEDTRVDFINGRDMTVVTGVSSAMPIYIGAAWALVLCVIIAAFLVRRKAKHALEN